jgi:hypothetical protein
MGDLRLSELDKSLEEEAKEYPEYDPAKSSCVPIAETLKNLTELREELIRNFIANNPQVSYKPTPLPQ